MKYIFGFLFMFALLGFIIHPAAALITGEPFLSALGWGILQTTFVGIIIFLATTND